MDNASYDTSDSARKGEVFDTTAWDDTLRGPRMSDATGKVMKTIAALVGELRGETPPAKLWNPSEHDQDETGNFRKKR